MNKSDQQNQSDSDSSIEKNQNKHKKRNSSNKSRDPQKMKEKIRKRQIKNQQFKKIFLQNKAENAYFDQETDQFNKNQYYSNLKVINYQNINQLISSTFNHARRRSNLFPIVDRHPDYTLRCVYTGNILSDSQGNMLEKCDEEHSFPQSFQRGVKSGTGRDMHAIFAASKSANGHRGNKPFGFIGIPIKIEQSRFGSIYKGNGRNTYVPKINQGAIARSSLYILTCYKGCANKDYFEYQLINWLKETAANTEVSLWQKHRNAELFRLQGNRNPFIDYPKWANSIQFKQGWQN